MREIKFRAWDGEKFVPQEHLYWKGYKFVAGAWNYNEEYIPADEQVDVEIMQYTGLRDKNGTEIYEGDTVKAYHREWEEYTTHSVKFCDGAFSIGRYWKDGIHSWYSMEQYESSELEVIGNIYQNPELLEDYNEKAHSSQIHS